MLNVHLSYKPLVSWRMLFWYGVRPSHFSLLENFKAWVVPGGGFRKRIIVQGMQLKRRFSCG